MTVSQELTEMIKRLSAMAADHREVVIEQIGPDYARKLLPLLEATRRGAVSTQLQVLVKAASRGETPEGMTSRAASALSRAVREVAGATDDSPTATQALPRGVFLDRALRLVGARG